MDRPSIITLRKVNKKDKANIILYYIYVESKMWQNELMYETETDSQI